MANEELKQQILDFYKSKAKSKTKFYMNDLRKMAPEGMTNREFKKVVNEMISEGSLMYFSTGSTTMIQLSEENVDSKI